MERAIASTKHQLSVSRANALVKEASSDANMLLKRLMDLGLLTTFSSPAGVPANHPLRKALQS
jgi:hypothetical protein